MDSTMLTMPSLESATNLADNIIVLNNSSFLASYQVPNVSIHIETSSSPQVQESINESNISDIDLSFLNDTVDSIVVPNENVTSVPIQTIISKQSNESSQAQKNEALSFQKNTKEINAIQESLKDNMVVMDITKPIHLSQNSLISVNGQQCILHYNHQLGQVIAYPLKKSEKNKKKRGRPRKINNGQETKLVNEDENTSISISNEKEHTLEEQEKEHTLDEQEKGLHIITDDGALVRRSARKRKKTKILKDYETGNLHQELGSDEENINKDFTSNHKKKMNLLLKNKKSYHSNQSLPINYMETSLKETGNMLNEQSTLDFNHKINSESQQAFLIELANGQTLILQIPKSLIPPGTSLEEAAKNLATKLNFSINQEKNLTNNETIQKHFPDSLVMDNFIVQEHSPGSTTNINDSQLLVACSNPNFENLVDSTSHEIEEPLYNNETSQATLANPNSDQICEEQEILIPYSLNNSETNQTSSLFYSSNTIKPSNSLNPLSENLINHILNNNSLFNRLGSGNLIKENVPNQSSFNENDLTEQSNIQVLLQNIVNVASEPSNENEDTQIKDVCVNEIKNNEFLHLKDDRPHSLHNENVVNLEKSNEHESLFESNELDSFQTVHEDLKVDSTSLTNNQEKSSSLAVITNMNFLEMPIIEGNKQSSSITFQNQALSLSSSKEDNLSSFTCKICHFQFNSNEEIINHFKENHPKFICTICNYMAKCSYMINRHMHRHKNVSFSCDICSKKYMDHYILKIHIKNVHMPADKIFMCNKCEKKFTRKAHLKRHLKIHNPDKPFKCSHCDYRGIEKSDISKHMLIHEPPKYHCDICNKAFRHNRNKELHLKRHKGQKEFKCGFCDFYGYTLTDIKRHIHRRHSQIQNEDCLSASQKASQENNFSFLIQDQDDSLSEPSSLPHLEDYQA